MLRTSFWLLLCLIVAGLGSGAAAHHGVILFPSSDNARCNTICTLVPTGRLTYGAARQQV
jgi:hypothetical protein